MSLYDRLSYDSTNKAEKVELVGTGGVSGVNNGYLLPAAGLSALVTLATGVSQGLFNGSLINLGTGPAYVAIYDTAGAVVLGTTVPAAVIILCANATPANGSGNNPTDINLKISSGTVKIAAVTGFNGATPVTTGTVFGTIFGK